MEINIKIEVFEKARFFSVLEKYLSVTPGEAYVKVTVDNTTYKIDPYPRAGFLKKLMHQIRYRYRKCTG